MKQFADIILPLPLNDHFTYRIPPEVSSFLKPGTRVQVPFGKNKTYAGMVRLIHDSGAGDIRIRDILEVLDEKPILAESHFLFWEWMARYYMCSLGEIYRAALPSGEARKKTWSPLKERYVRLNEHWQDEERLSPLLDQYKKAPAQKDIILKYLELSGLFSAYPVKEVSRHALVQKSGRAAPAYQQLLRQEVLCEYELEKSRLSDTPKESLEIAFLSEAQLRAKSAIEKQPGNKQVVLLHGVASSGKTEVYMHMAKQVLSEGKQVLFMLPEIALTAQIISRVSKVFGRKVAFYHSRQGRAMRFEVFRKAFQRETDEAQIIIAPRSGVFLPFRDLGLVIVDEEQDSSYKQQNPAPRYHGRDAAIYLASLNQARVLLGSATPSLESYFNAERGKYGLVELKDRYVPGLPPDMLMLDMKHAYRKKRVRGHFSEKLVSLIGESLEQREQVILFQNRRGYAPYLECRECGFVPVCKHCDVSLTYHRQRNILECHYCGYRERVPKNCPVCGSGELKTAGFGTEKLEEELSILFPRAKVIRLDLDTVRSGKDYNRILFDFESGQADILVGTQIVTKGLDFDNVRLVGIMNADNMLHFPDFRSFEKSYQLLTQVSGRAGRKDKQGMVVLQTRDPNHPVLQWVYRNDYRAMYRNQMSERKTFKYPPYYRLIRIRMRARDKDSAEQFSSDFASRIKKEFPFPVLGPQYPPVQKVQRYYIRQILLKIPRGEELQKLKQKIILTGNALLREKIYRSVMVAYDADPV